MCGINGFIQNNNHLDNSQLETLIDTMNNQIVHRGPDENGKYITDNFALGMTRLSIIDLKSGSQPIFNKDRTKLIVLNGEIYNYKELRKILLSKGYVFTTDSDTEVILHAYEEFGAACLDHLLGMFSFAIYDLTNKFLFIARDRAGEKPLYYHRSDNYFIFASELKSILSTKLVPKIIDTKALVQYLRLTYIPAPLTILEDVFKLPQAHYLTIDRFNKLEIKKYWDVSFDQKNIIKDYNTCKIQLKKTLYEAVERCMVSDVPIGAFLSGGKDSTTIVGLMSSISSTPINTFTIGYKDKRYDESNLANITAKRFKTNHHAYVLDYDTVLGEIDAIVKNIDEPFADSSAIPTYFVSKYASEYVKVALTGDAGDELFGGYNKYLIGYYSKRLNLVSSILGKNTLKKIIDFFPEKTLLQNKIRKVVDFAGENKFEQRLSLMCLGFNSVRLNDLLAKNYPDHSLDFIHEYYNHEMKVTDELAQTLYTDFHVILEGDMLAKVDRMSMLNSLETRVPLLDKNIIELAARIPSEFKVHKKNLKIIFRDTFSDIIPKELLTSQKKGFEVPIDDWFRGPLKLKLLKALNKDFVIQQGIFDYNFIQQIINEHMTGTRNRKSELWTLYVFQEWYKNYFL